MNLGKYDFVIVGGGLGLTILIEFKKNDIY
jgi:hypothetical protein